MVQLYNYDRTQIVKYFLFWFLSALVATVVSLKRPIGNIMGNCMNENQSISTILKSHRGRNYYLKDEAVREGCMITAWNMSHFVLYFFAGYIFPNLWMESLLIGLVWEVAEKQINCHCPLDIVFNSLGLSTGVLFRIKC